MSARIKSRRIQYDTYNYFYLEAAIEKETTGKEPKHTKQGAVTRATMDPNGESRDETGCTSYWRTSPHAAKRPNASLHLATANTEIATKTAGSGQARAGRGGHYSIQ